MDKTYKMGELLIFDNELDVTECTHYKDYYIGEEVIVGFDGNLYTTKDTARIGKLNSPIEGYTSDGLIKLLYQDHKRSKIKDNSIAALMNWCVLFDEVGLHPSEHLDKMLDTTLDVFNGDWVPYEDE